MVASFDNLWSADGKHSNLQTPAFCDSSIGTCVYMDEIRSESHADPSDKLEKGCMQYGYAANLH